MLRPEAQNVSRFPCNAGQRSGTNALPLETLRIAACKDPVRTLGKVAHGRLVWRHQEQSSKRLVVRVIVRAEVAGGLSRPVVLIQIEVDCVLNGTLRRVRREEVGGGNVRVRLGLSNSAAERQTCGAGD